MDKREALKTLIENSTILSEEVKSGLLAKLATMSDEDVVALGVMLAKEMEMNVDQNPEFAKKVEDSAKSQG